MEETRRGYASLALVNSVICIVSVLGLALGRPDWWAALALVAIVSATIALVSAIRLLRTRPTAPPRPGERARRDR